MKKKTNIWKRITNNWALKIFSLCAAFFLWLLVMTVENPEDQKVFYNIPVRLINTNILTDEDMVYEVIDKTETVPRVTVTAKKSIRDELSAADIVAEADFSNLTVTNTVEIQFFSLRYNDQITSIKGSSEMIKLNIERKRSKRLELSVETYGELPNNYMIYDITPDQNRIEVSGPESVIDRIDSAVLMVDVTDSTDSIATYAAVKLYDKELKEISTDNLTMNAETVRVKVDIMSTKTVPVIYKPKGTPANGYLMTGECTGSMENVELAGDAASLANIQSIVIEGDALDVTGASENFFASVNIKDYLPKNIILADKTASGKVNVIVHIESSVEGELKISDSRLQLTGVPEGYQAEIVEAKEEYTFRVRGLREKMESWQEVDLTGIANLKSILPAEAEDYSGIYEVEVFVSLSDDLEVIQPLKIHVKLSKTEENG